MSPFLSVLSRCLFLVLALVFSSSASDNVVDKKLASQVERYLKGVEFIAADFEQIGDNGEVYTGRFWLKKVVKSKSSSEPQVKIEYTSGLNQDILVSDSVVTVFDREASKKYVQSILQTPIYSILTGTLDLSKETFEIVENSDEYLRLRINSSSTFGGVQVMLVFSKYTNGNLKNLEAWIIDDGKNKTLFSFDPKTLSVNDAKRVPDDVFSLPDAR